MFYLILNIDRSDLRMFACFSYLGVPTVASSKKQMLKNKKKRTETGHFFAFFSCPVVGRDTFSPLAPIPGPEKNVAMPHPLLPFSWRSV